MFLSSQSSLLVVYGGLYRHQNQPTHTLQQGLVLCDSSLQPVLLRWNQNIRLLCARGFQQAPGRRMDRAEKPQIPDYSAEAAAEAATTALESCSSEGGG